VTVTASVTAVSAAPAPIAPGATKFDFTSTEQRADLQVFVVAPKPGRTTDQVIAALKSNPDSSFEVLDIVASVTLSPGAKRAVTADIKAGTSYLLINDAGKENPAQWIYTPLATGGGGHGHHAAAARRNGDAARPAFHGRRHPAARRHGARAQQRLGTTPCPGAAAAARRQQRRVRRALLGSSEAAFNRVVDFRNSIELSSILTRGSVTDQDVRFPRQGRYALVCFIENHQAQGMYRVVNVR